MFLHRRSQITCVIIVRCDLKCKAMIWYSLKISLYYLQAILPSPTFRSVWGFISPEHHWPTTKLVMLDDITGSITFTMASPDSFTPVACAQCVSALICEENRRPVADLAILVFCMNANWAAQCLAVGTGPTKGRLALLLPLWRRFLTVRSETCTLVGAAGRLVVVFSTNQPILHQWRFTQVH